MERLAVMNGWPDQSGSQMVFFGQVSGEQKGGRKKWPLSSGVLDPWASLGSQSACAITCCLLHASWSAGQWDVFWGLSWTLALRLTPPPLLLLLFLIFSLFSHSSISDVSTCFLYLLFITFSNPSFLVSSPESSIFFIFLLSPSAIRLFACVGVFSTQPTKCVSVLQISLLAAPSSGE